MTPSPPHGTAAAHKAMASQAVAAGQLPQALWHMQQACGLEPGSASLQLEYGCLLAHAGQLAPALAPLERATVLQPALADAWYFLGVTLARLERRVEAIPLLRHALLLAPGQQRIIEALALAEFHAGFPADALPLWRELARLRPDHDDTALKLGETLSRLADNDEARAVYRDAVHRRPQSADLWMALGQAEEDNGDRDAAAAAYEASLALRPGWAFPLAGMLGLLRGKAPDARVEEARALQGGTGLSDPDRALVGYELGKVFDARGDYAAAMASWHDANAARRRAAGEFDAPALQQRVDRVIARFDGEFPDPSETGSQDTRPVFIVGMPRSGTTLTEQIIAAHPLAHGCGELPDLPLVARNVLTRPGGSALEPWGEDFSAAALRRATDRYLQGAGRHAPADAQRLVDKAPMNFHLLGLVALMFPRARVIWCRRDPRDIAVSIYGENFALEERFATRLDGIGHCINQQERLMRHWQSVLPLPILPLQYEALVAEPEAQARRLVDFIGLPWDPACLQFHRSDKGVQTPSRWQVRQPVHTRSAGRWRHYGFALDPLLAVLDPELLRS